MINEYDVHLTFQVSKQAVNKLVNEAESEGYDCELTYLLDEVKEFIDSKIQCRVKWLK